MSLLSCVARRLGAEAFLSVGSTDALDKQPALPFTFKPCFGKGPSQSRLTFTIITALAVSLSGYITRKRKREGRLKAVPKYNFEADDEEDDDDDYAEFDITDSKYTACIPLALILPRHVCASMLSYLGRGVEGSTSSKKRHFKSD